MKVTPLVDKAARIVIGDGIASVPKLRIQLAGSDVHQVGWLLKRLHFLGVVGPYRGWCIGRSVLMTIDDWEAFLQDDKRKGGAPAPEPTNEGTER